MHTRAALLRKYIMQNMNTLHRHLSAKYLHNYVGTVPHAIHSIRHIHLYTCYRHTELLKITKKAIQAHSLHLHLQKYLLLEFCLINFNAIHPPIHPVGILMKSKHKIYTTILAHKIEKKVDCCKFEK